MGYRHLPKLRAALKQALKIDTTTPKTKAAYVRSRGELQLRMGLTPSRSRIPGSSRVIPAYPGIRRDLRSGLRHSGRSPRSSWRAAWTPRRGVPAWRRWWGRASVRDGRSPMMSRQTPRASGCTSTLRSPASVVLVVSALAAAGGVSKPTLEMCQAAGVGIPLIPGYPGFQNF